MFHWDRFWLQVGTGLIVGVFVALTSMICLRGPQYGNRARVLRLSILAGLVVFIVTPLLDVVFQLSGH